MLRWWYCALFDSVLTFEKSSTSNLQKCALNLKSSCLLLLWVNLNTSCSLPFPAYWLRDQQDVCTYRSCRKSSAFGQGDSASSSVNSNRVHYGHWCEWEPIFCSKPQARASGGRADGWQHADNFHCSGPRSLHAANIAKVCMSILQCLCYGMGGEQRGDMWNDCIYHSQSYPNTSCGFCAALSKGIFGCRERELTSIHRCVNLVVFSS